MIYHKPSAAFQRHGHTNYCNAFEYMFVFSQGAPKTWHPLRDRPNRYAGTIMTGSVRNTDGSTKPKHSAGQAVAPFGYRNNVWSYDVGFMKSSPDKIAFQHPAIFPEALARDQILTWSNPGDVVLDPFTGSGTTLKAAWQLGRRFIGVELNPAYAAIARQRLGTPLERDLRRSAHLRAAAFSDA